jgi:hypothetical protein
MMTHRDPLPGLDESGFPLGDTRNWVMTHHRAGAYAPEVSCRAGANENPDRKDAAMNRHPAGSEDGPIGDPHKAVPAEVEGARPDRRQ